MIAESKPEPGLPGQGLRIIGVAGDGGEHLRLHPADGIGIEARGAERQAEQPEGLVAVTGQKPHAAGEAVPIGIEAEFDAKGVQAALEGR